MLSKDPKLDKNDYEEDFGDFVVSGECNLVEILDQVQLPVPAHSFERLPIPYEKRERYSYREFEGYARNSEIEATAFANEGKRSAADECLNVAKYWRNRAKDSVPLDEALEIEEKALDSGNVLSIAAYREMGSGDKILWELRGLEKFVHYTQFSEVYYWYE